MSDLAEEIYAATGLTLAGPAVAGIAKILEARDARITELEAALRFYDDEENWRRNGQLDPNSGNFTGGPARAALEGGK